jgi:thiamine biosynthesis lipoprotein
VRVCRDTFTVLQRGLALAAESGGAFDFTVAPVLARWGLHDRRLRVPHAGDWRDVELLPRQRVRFARPLALDLGGIAKGFAVDLAITALQAAGLTAATVNAGGDLRTFGPQAVAVHLRDPRTPQMFAHQIEIQNSAVATSSPCFAERRWRGRIVSHLVNPRNGRATTGAISVTVRAPECWLADALTKVVLYAPQLAEKILAHHEAQAFVFRA